MSDSVSNIPISHNMPKVGGITYEVIKRKVNWPQSDLSIHINLPIDTGYLRFQNYSAKWAQDV